MVYFTDATELKVSALSGLAVQRQAVLASRRAFAPPADAWTAIGISAAALTLYLRTAAPTLYSLDAAEFAVAIRTWGIPHATGYPLFLLLGRLFATLIPAGDLAYRVTAMTAVFAALTPGFLFLVLRTLRVHQVQAAIACLFFAVTYFQWSSAVVAKEHSLRDALLAFTLWSLVRWQLTNGRGWLISAALATSLSLTNHMSAALYAPIVAIFVLAQRRLRLRQVLLLLAIGLAGLLPYAYLPLASLAHPVFDMAGRYDADGVFHAVDLASPAGLLWMLSGRQFGSMMLSSPSIALANAARLAAWLWGDFFGVGVVLVAFGIPAFARRNRLFAMAVVLLATAHSAFFLSYGAPDLDAMFGPLYLLLTIPLAFGLSSALALVRRLWLRRLALALLWAGVAGALVVNFPLVNLSSDRRVRVWAADFLDSLPPHTTVLARWVTSGPLDYLILVEGRRPDVTVIDRFLMPTATMQTFIERHAADRPVVLDAPDLVPADGLAFQALPGPQGAVLSRDGAPAFPGVLVRPVSSPPVAHG